MENTETATTIPTPRPLKKSKPTPAASTPVGLDLGYGYVKITLPAHSHIFPSLVAPFNHNDISLSLHHPDDIVEVDGQSYLVGLPASQSEFRFQEQWDGWWSSPIYKALLQKAAKVIPKGASIVTGLPLHLYTSSVAKQQVATLMKQVLHAKSITLLCQGLGAFSAATKQNPALLTQRTAIADVGTRTTELIGMARFTFLPQQSRGIVLGVAKVFKILADNFVQTYGRRIDPFEIEEAYRERKPLIIRNLTLTPKDLSDRINPLREDLLQHLHEEMIRVWDITNRQDPKTLAPQFDHILFCGGGALFLEDLLKARYPHAMVLSQGQFANAQGYYEFAQQQSPAVTSNALPNA